jgi:hypothetical protein
MTKLMSAEPSGGDESLASDNIFINQCRFYRCMDAITAKVNQALGIYPDDVERRVGIGIIVAVIGAISVLLALLYIFSAFRTDLMFATGGIENAAYASKNLGYFLMVLYALLIGSLLYYIFLPWKSKKRTF